MMRLLYLRHENKEAGNITLKTLQNLKTTATISLITLLQTLAATLVRMPYSKALHNLQAESSMTKSIQAPPNGCSTTTW